MKWHGYLPCIAGRNGYQSLLPLYHLSKSYGYYTMGSHQCVVFLVVATIHSLVAKRDFYDDPSNRIGLKLLLEAYGKHLQTLLLNLGVIKMLKPQGSRGVVNLLLFGNDTSIT